ncbi:MAG TPA: sigma-54 dependent transcriptional regulator [Polyangia bacterium]|nr:sigma-54 dependent transcriptional regulator [Polyangia bacterium]
MSTAPNSNRLRVLVVDDEKNIRQTLSVFLEKVDCDVEVAASGEAALAALARKPMDLAFLDLRLGSERGQDVIPRLLALAPELLIVVFTAYATVETAVETLKRGAWDYLPKPYTPEQIRQIVSRARERRALAQRVSELESQLASAAPELDLTSQSPAMRQVFDLIGRAAKSSVQVLFRGETGTGKTALARVLHAESARRDHPFAVVNCPTLSEELLASELFGHARGAFTGAVKDQPGRVDAAHGGTLFLDEIGEIPSALQAKLLRFIQDKQFERIGENETRTADVRIVAATNRDIEADIKAGHFREDLFYRLNVVEIRIPPLRERPEDILPLARRFVAFFAASIGHRGVELSKEAEAMMMAYRWPGNVRELRNAVERAVILWPAEVIGPEAFPDRLASTFPVRPFVGGDFPVEEIEREHILRVTGRTETLEQAAEILKIDTSTLWRKRKRYE